MIKLFASGQWLQMLSDMNRVEQTSSEQGDGGTMEEVPSEAVCSSETGLDERGQGANQQDGNRKQDHSASGSQDGNREPVEEESGNQDAERKSGEVASGNEDVLREPLQDASENPGVGRELGHVASEVKNEPGQLGTQEAEVVSRKPTPKEEVYQTREATFYKETSGKSIASKAKNASDFKLQAISESEEATFIKGAAAKNPESATRRREAPSKGEGSQRGRLAIKHTESAIRQIKKATKQKQVADKQHYGGKRMEVAVKGLEEAVKTMNFAIQAVEAVIVPMRSSTGAPKEAASPPARNLTSSTKDSKGGVRKKTRRLKTVIPKMTENMELQISHGAAAASSHATVSVAKKPPPEHCGGNCTICQQLPGPSRRN